MRMVYLNKLVWAERLSQSWECDSRSVNDWSDMFATVSRAHFVATNTSSLSNSHERSCSHVPLMVVRDQSCLHHSRDIDELPVSKQRVREKSAVLTSWCV